MTVYHGSVAVVEHPDLDKSKVRIDFGPGFYVTTFREQAEKWARRKALRKRMLPVVTEFDLDVNSLSGLNVKRFSESNREWLDFVSACRRGDDVGVAYDVIIGPVADDAVFEAVNMYLTGLWDVERTLQEIRYYPRNDQIVFKNETALKQSLRFVRSYELEMPHV